jgi:ribosomal protein S2
MEKELKSKTSVHKSAHSAAETGHSSVAGGEKHNHNKTSQGLSVANASNIEKATTEFFDTNGAKLGIKVLIPVKTLMESGAYMGLPAKARNPKMSPYIAENKGSKAQIINLIKTIAFLDQACSVVQDIVKRGGRVLFVGTQNDVIKNHIKDECARTQSFYVNQR